MSFAKSADAKMAGDIFLRARETRQAVLSAALGLSGKPVIFLSLNIPGADKSPPGYAALFESMRAALVGDLPSLAMMNEGRDALGPFLIASLEMDVTELKKRCIALETASAAGRLIDLDVYAALGLQVDRQSLGLPGRPCLVCDQAAVDCIRSKRHPYNEVIGKVNELLAPFIA